jgi:predicted phage-related endonuclease
MIILNLVQGSQEWLNIRSTHFTASEAPAMKGASKYMSRNELLTLKKTGVAKPVSPTQQKLFDKGHAAEDSQREIIELDLFIDLPPVVGSLQVEGMPLLASFDGYPESINEPWEHKLYNQTLAENVRNEVLEPHYFWQLEHQMLVCGANRCLFTTSDGTEEKAKSMYYESVPERRAELIAGWKQFVIDLANHEVVAKAEKLVAKEMMALPKLEISLVGNVSASNLVAYESTALTFIDNISTDLLTDQDFIDAEGAVKFCQNGEKELEEVKKRALSDTADIAALFETIDTLKESMRQKRLTLDKLVKSRKAEIKADIKAKAVSQYEQLISFVNAKVGVQVATTVADFDGAMKGKRTIESLENAIDCELARVKIELTQTGELIDANLSTLTDLAANHRFLFNDFAQLVLKPTEDLINLIKMRITEHDQAETERKRVEQLRMEQAAQEKAEREVQARAAAEEQRIRSEERAKAQAEQDAIAQQQQAVIARQQAEQAPSIGNHAVNNEGSAKATEQRLTAQQDSQTSVGKESAPIEAESPVKQRLSTRFANTTQSGRSEMLRQLKFWKNEYGVRNSEFTDLLNIINQHAYLEEQESDAA